MMVPRSYPFLHQAAPSASRRPSEKMGARSPRNPFTSNKMRIPSPERKQEQTEKPGVRLPDSAAAPAAPSPAVPMASKPVVIPPRTPARSATSTQTVRARGHHGGRNMRLPSNHRSDAIPPAVAALLAVTEIPPMAPRRRKGSTMDKTISMDELIQEWKQDDSDVPSSVAGSPLDLLLGRVDEFEEEYGSLRSLENEKESIMTSRSLSSESLSSIMPPSLEPDAPSLASNWDNLSTPDSYGRKSFSERKEKNVQSPPKEDCILDHPLLHFNPEELEDLAELEVPDIVTSPPPSIERFRSFRSNLTASLQALKSAAKSFSNFTAPSVPPDDLLTRSLLSPKFTSEMRPKQLPGLPSPALRRYLNPQPTPISPSELHMHLHDAQDSHAPMIQMQTYERRSSSRRGSSSSKRRAADPFSEAGRALSALPAVRQREPRENSDFLRVIVLEMNMRRVGKLDAKAVGRARIWLPPRKPAAAASTSAPTRAVSAHAEVPVRWVGVVVDEA